MEYLFGQRTINNTRRHTLRVKGQQLTAFEPGSYNVHEEHHQDVIITDSFRVEKLYETGSDKDGNNYAWYILSEYTHNIDRSPAAENKAKEAMAVAESSRDVNSITFVTLAEAGNIDGVTAGEHADLFAEWNDNGVQYEIGNIRRYQDKLYKCISAHKSQSDWTPDVAVSLWVTISDPAEEWPEWSAPVGAHDAYQVGDRVSHNGKHWTSNTPNNVWEPGQYGWDEVTE